MRHFHGFLPVFLALASLAVADPACPGSTTASEKKQGNTKILTCLDAEGLPHGPFEVWAFPDTSLTGSGVRIVDGRFIHGKQAGDWTTYGRDGLTIRTSRFVDGVKLEDGHDGE